MKTKQDFKDDIATLHDIKKQLCQRLKVSVVSSTLMIELDEMQLALKENLQEQEEVEAATEQYENEMMEYAFI